MKSNKRLKMFITPVIYFITGNMPNTANNTQLQNMQLTKKYRACYALSCRVTSAECCDLSSSNTCTVSLTSYVSFSC